MVRIVIVGVLGSALLAACSHRPKAVTPSGPRVSYELILARDHYQRGNHGAAIRSYQSCPEADMTAQDYVNLGKSYASYADPERAIQAYQRALTLEPQLAEARAALAAVYLFKGRTFDPRAALALVEAEEHAGRGTPELARIRESIEAWEKRNAPPPPLPPRADRVPGDEDSLIELVRTLAQNHPKKFFKMVPAPEIVANFDAYKGRYAYLDGTGLGTDNYRDTDDGGFEDTVYNDDLGLYHIRFPFQLEGGRSWRLGDMAFIVRVDDLVTAVNRLGMTVTMPLFVVVVAYDTEGIRRQANRQPMFNF